MKLCILDNDDLDPAAVPIWGSYATMFERLLRDAGFQGDGDLVEAGIPIRIASIIRENRTMLEKQGWTLKELPGQGHGVCMTPDLLVPPVRYFLDLSL